MNAPLADLGTPIATNANGMQVWIIPPDAFKSLITAVATTPVVEVMSRPRIQTRNDMACSLWYGGPPMIAGSSFGASLALPIQTYYPSLEIEVVPTRVSEMFKLTFQLQSHPGPDITNSPIFELGGFRVTVSNAWGLVINAGDVHSQRDAGCWFLISSTLCDTSGEPLKP